MRIGLHRDDLMEVGFLSGVLIDFPAQLVGTSAVHVSRFAACARLDRAQAFKEQDAARIAGADLGYLAGDLVGSVFVEMINMPPELPLAVLAFDWPARLPLLLGDLFEMARAMGVQAMIGHKDGFNDALGLAHGDHGEVFDVHIDRDRNQLGISPALHDLFRCDLLHLGDVQCCRSRSQDQLGTLPLPVGLRQPSQQVA